MTSYVRILQQQLLKYRWNYCSRRTFGCIERPVLEDYSASEDAVTPIDSTNRSSIQILGSDWRGRIGSCISTDDVCSLFYEHRQRVKPGDLILLLSKIVAINSRPGGYQEERSHSLWRSTDFCLIDLIGLDCKLNIMRMNLVVADMYSEVLSRINSFSITQMLYLNRIGMFIRGYHNKMLLSHSEKAVSACAWQLEPTDLCRSVTVLAKSSENVDFVKLIGHVALRMFRDLDVSQRVLVFKSLATASKGSTLFLQGAVKHALNPVMFVGKDIIDVLACYASKQSSFSSAVLDNLLERASTLDLQSLKPQDLCNLIWATCKYSKIKGDIFKRAEDLIIRYSPDFTASNVSMLLWGLAEAEYSSSALLDALEAAAIRCSPSMSTENVAICIKSIANLKSDGDPSAFHKHIEEEIIDKICHFNGLDLAMLAEGYAKLGLGSATLHQCIQECALKYASDLPADCLAKLLWSYGRLVGKESFFSGLQFYMLQRANQFATHELCRVLWAYAVMRFFDICFWGNCLSLLDLEHIRSNKRCSLLYPTLLEVTAVRKDLKNVDTLRLLNHTRPMFMEQEMSTYCLKLGERIVKLLGSLEIQANSPHSFDGFLLDSYFEAQDQMFGVLVYSAHNTIGPSSRPDGAMLLKTGYLRRKGLKLIHLLREPFMELNDEQALLLLQKQMQQP